MNVLIAPIEKSLKYPTASLDFSGSNLIQRQPEGCGMFPPRDAPLDQYGPGVAMAKRRIH